MARKPFLATTTLILAVASSAFAGEVFNIDPAHSSIGFSIKHLGLSNVQGQFKEFSGSLNYDSKSLENSTGTVTIKTASINTQNEKRDKHLSSPDFFDAAKYPEIKFEISKLRKRGDSLSAVGTLDMHGVKKLITLPFTLTGPVKDPFGGTRVGVEAATTLKRNDFGITWNKNLDSGGVMLGEDVKVQVNVEAAQKK